MTKPGFKSRLSNGPNTLLLLLDESAGRCVTTSLKHNSIRAQSWVISYLIHLSLPFCLPTSLLSPLPFPRLFSFLSLVSEWAIVQAQRSVTPTPAPLTFLGAVLKLETKVLIFLPTGLQGLVTWREVLVGSYMYWQRKEGHQLMDTLEKSVGGQRGRLLSDDLSGRLWKETSKE